MPQRKPYGKASEPIDQWLESQGFYRKHTARDATCLFRAVAEQLFYTQNCHDTVRKQCVEFIQRRRHLFEGCIEEGSFETYISRIQSLKEWGGQLEMEAMSRLYHREFIIFQHSGKPPYAATSNGFKENILLCSSSDSHYDSIYPKPYIEKAAFCQSVVYEMLYENVFKLQDVSYAVDKMLHKSARSRRDSYMNQNYVCSSGSLEAPIKHGWRLEPDYDGELNVKALLMRGITPFPYKVAKALDPDIYRNIEFDIWSDLRREMRLGLLAGMSSGDLQVGVKCIVKLQPDQIFHAHIQEMAPDNGPVIVFVEELGRKCTVPHDILEPLPRNQRMQWALPYRQQRQLASMSAKTSFLTLPDFGNKWRKSKINKQRKMKEMLMPVTISHQVQCPSNGQQQVASSNRISKHPTLECDCRFDLEQHSNQMSFQGFPAENFTYTNNMSVQTILEQSPVRQMAPDCRSDGVTVTSQADSTTLNTLVESEPAAQLLAVSSYSEPPPQVATLPSYILCNTTQPRVNIHAQKSMQINGNDLPFSDIPTLRFFYNLGHDYLRSGYVLWPNSMLPPLPTPTENNNTQLLPDSTMSPEEEAYQLRPVQQVLNTGTPWQPQQPQLPVLEVRMKEAEHNGQATQPIVQDHAVVGGNDTATILPNTAVHSPVPQQMVEPYSNPTLVPYYPVEIDSVPYYTMGTPYSCMMRPTDVEMMPNAPQMQQLQPPTMYTPQMAPVMYHHQPPPPTHMARWVPSPEGVPQYNVAM